MGLGADNILLGVLSTVPQFFVIFQFAGAYLVESGISRKRLTVAFALIAPLCWFLIAGIPLFEKSVGRPVQFAMLVGVISLVTVANQFAGSARGSWVGELIPEQRRGRFFGYTAMFWGIIAAGFAISEGKFLDVIKSHGLFAFTTLFFFGSVFGLVAATLHIPQPDCPLPGAQAKTAYMEIVRRTFRNRPFVTLATVHAIVAMSAVAGPFWAAYALRDVGLSYFSLGILNSIGTVAAVLTSPFWGRVVTRYGCRPVLILGLALMVPCSIVYIAIPPTALKAAYWLIPWSNLFGGLGGSAMGVAISTLVYKTSHPEGRSVQFALYNVFVVLVGAPMPVLGGWLVSALSKAGHPIDLRLTFYLWSLFLLAALFVARRLREPDSVGARALVLNYLPNDVAAWVGARMRTMYAAGALLGITKKPVLEANDPPSRAALDPSELQGKKGEERRR
jgi:hypothetical protein